MIAVNARLILQGWNLIGTFNRGSDFRVFTRLDKDGREVTDYDIVRWIGRIYDASVSHGTELSLILSLVKEDVAGTYAINELIQKKRSLAGPEFTIGRFTYHIGDKIIFGENRYDIGFMNGDIGVIRDISPENEVTVECPSLTIKVQLKDLSSIRPTYALTIHKSQGSEAKDVIIVFPSNSELMASRQLLYTAFTRAKRSVTLIGTTRIIGDYIFSSRLLDRETGLRDILSGNIKEVIFDNSGNTDEDAYFPYITGLI